MSEDKRTYAEQLLINIVKARAAYKDLLDELDTGTQIATNADKNDYLKGYNTGFAMGLKLGYTTIVARLDSIIKL